MLKNYLVTAINSLLKNKLFTFINLVGLAIGLASTILIGLFVADELSYDAHYADADRIFRISRDFTTQNLYLAANAPLAAELLKADFADIEYVARLFGGQVLLSRDELAFYETNARFADPDFFRIFQVQWIAGDEIQALARPNTVVLTESIANKYFGSIDVIGQRLMLERAVPLEVTGVIRDLPHNTHLDLGIVGSLATVRPIAGENFFTSWGSNNFHTYIKLKPGVAIESISSQFPAFLQRHVRADAPLTTAMTATPIDEIHLHSTRRNEMKTPGSINTVYMFSATAVFILLIACFNFMNLSTARATRRGREVGIRKALGASRGQVVSQFVGESLLMTLLASSLALAMVEAVMPTFNSFIGKQLTLDFLAGWRIPAALLMLILTVGIFAGSYPAFFLSAFKPVQVLRSVLAKGGSALFRNALVIMQFSIAIVLVVATLVVIQQMRFARDNALGFQREQILIINGSPTVGLGSQWDAMRRELLRNPDILSVTSSGQTPLEINTNAMGVAEAGDRAGGAMPIMRVDYDFFATYNIPLLAGRGFSADFPADRLKAVVSGSSSGNGFVLNRAAVEEFGWTAEEALGQSLQAAQHSGTVVGVVENSYFESVRTTIKPMLFFLPQYIDGATATMPDASIRLSGNNMEATLAYIDSVWKQFMPDFPMARYFLDDDFNALFHAEQQQGQLFYYFALLAIFIACMGLYGLASFNAERRTKEIGVRKVMGSSIWSIVLLLTNDFSRLVLISNVIAWPIAWFAMDRWLQNFAYRVDLTPVIFVGSGLIALSIAWVTVGGTAAKAAAAKPVLALRYE